MALIVVASGKGGVGKTTTALALAAALEELKVSSILLDADIGASLTASAGYEADGTQIYDLLTQNENIEAYVLRSAEGLAFVPGSARVASLASSQVDALARRLRAISRERHIIVDTAQSLMLNLTRAAIKAADIVVVPILLEPKSIERSPLDVVALIRAYKTDPDLFFIATMAQTNLKLSQQQLNRLAELGITLSATIPRAVAASEADLVHKSIIAYAPKNPASEAYRQLARNIVGRLNSSRLNKIAPATIHESAAIN
jgi:cellulose biosynthesis protein BcsQ